MFQAILDWMNTQVFALGGTPVLLSELVGFVLGVATVWLVARANIWTFPIGIVQCAFFLALFLHADLFADAWLQVFFIVVQIFGWWAWLKAGPNRTELRVNNMPTYTWVGVGVALTAFIVLMTPVLREAHGAYPVADATTTGMSVLAQFLLSFKFIQNWYLWIAADLIYIPLYFAKELYFTSILYVIFLTLCVMGLRHWKGLKREQDTNSKKLDQMIDDALGTQTQAWDRTSVPAS